MEERYREVIEITDDDRSGPGITAATRRLDGLRRMASATTAPLRALGRGLASVASIASGFVIGQALYALPNLLADAANGARDDEAATKRLEQSIRNLGGSFDFNLAAVNAAIAAGAKLAFTDDEIRNSYQFLAAATGDSNEALKRQKIAMDFARGAGIPLEQASKLLGKVTAENVQAFKRMGITIREGATEQEALAIIQGKFANQADAYAQSSKGQAEAATIAFDEMKEALGYALLPLLSRLGRLVIDNLPAIQKTVEWIGDKLGAGVGLALDQLVPLQRLFARMRPALDTLADLGRAFFTAITSDPGALGVVGDILERVFGPRVAGLMRSFLAIGMSLIRTVRRIAGAFKNLAEGRVTVTDVLVGIRSIFEDFGADVWHEIQTLGKRVLDTLKTEGPKWATAAWDWVKAAGRTAATQLGLLVLKIKTWARGDGPRALKDALLGLADSAWEWIKTAAGTAGTALAGLLAPVSDWARGEGPSQIAAALVGLADSAWSWITTAAANAATALGGLIDAARDWAMGTGPTEIASAIVGLAKGAWDWIQTAALFAGVRLFGLVAAVRDWAMGDGPGQLGAAIVGLAKSAWDWVMVAVVTAHDKLSPLIDSITLWLSDTAAPAVLEASKTLGQQVYEGTIQGFAQARAQNPEFADFVALLEQLRIPSNLQLSWENFSKTAEIIAGWLGASGERTHTLNLKLGNLLNLMTSGAGGGLLAVISGWADILAEISKMALSWAESTDRQIKNLQTLATWVQNNGGILETLKTLAGMVLPTIPGTSPPAGAGGGTFDNSATSPAPPTASGGIAIRPQVREVGEGGEPEAIIPLSQAPRFGFGPGAGHGVSIEVASGAVNVTFQVPEAPSGENAERFAKKIAPAVTREIVRQLKIVSPNLVGSPA